MQPHRQGMGHTSRPCRRAAALGGRRGARHHRPRACREGQRLRLRLLSRRRRTPRSCADQLLHRPARPRARIRGSVATRARQPRDDDGNGAASQVRGRRVRGREATISSSFRRPRSPSRICIATRSSTPSSCRWHSSRTRRVSAARLDRRARTRAESCARTNSTRSSWCVMRRPRTRRASSSC